MQVDWDHELSAGFAGNYIRRKARQLIGKTGFTLSDRPDIEQELAIKVVQCISRFDPTRGHWNAFVATVVERHVATILKSRRARKRGQPTLTSFEAIACDLSHS